MIARDGGAEARKDEDEDDDALHRHAGDLRGLGVAADGVDVAAEDRAAQQDVARRRRARRQSPSGR